MMTEDQRPIDMSLCGPWNSAGIERWNLLDRSWSVFALNATELIAVLGSPMNDLRILQMVTTGGPAESAPFWERLDQRLHNELAAITTLVDHTRRWTSYYKQDAGELV